MFALFGAIGAFELILLIFVGIIILPGIFFLITLQKALERCSPECRTTTPGSVWLMLIPLFNIVWQFLLVSHISKSLNNEFQKRGMDEDPEPGKSIGLAYCILGLLGFIPILGYLTSLASFVCWIIYWVKINDYSTKIALQDNI